MKRKIFNGLIAVIGIAVLAFTVACASTPAEDETLPPIGISDNITGTALAVQAIERLRSGEIERLRNVGTPQFIPAGVMLTGVEFAGRVVMMQEPRHYRANIVFATTANTLDVRFENTQMVEIDEFGNRRWINIDPSATAARLGGDFGLGQGRTRGDFERLRNEIMQQLHLFSLDQAAAVNNFLGNFQYNHAYLRILPEMGRQVFIEEYLIGRTYRWSLTLVEFAENRNASVDKRFVARFRQNVITPTIIGGALSITLNVYTNDPSLGMVTAGHTVPFSGTLFSITGTDNATFNLMHE